MNSSDNVVRAGFTPKHINVEELLAIVDTSPLATPVITPDASGTYLSPSDAFSVQRIVATSDLHFEPVAHHRVIFGPLSDNSATTPQMFLLATGDTGNLDANAGDKIFVCHQL
jgi:mannose-6-phosphate isomerase class I